MHIDRSKTPRLTPFEAHAIHAMEARLKLTDSTEKDRQLRTAIIDYHEAQCALLFEEKPV